MNMLVKVMTLLNDAKIDSIAAQSDDNDQSGLVPTADLVSKMYKIKTNGEGLALLMEYRKKARVDAIQAVVKILIDDAMKPNPNARIQIGPVLDTLGIHPLDTEFGKMWNDKHEEDLKQNTKQLNNIPLDQQMTEVVEIKSDSLFDRMLTDTKEISKNFKSVVLVGDNIPVLVPTDDSNLTFNFSSVTLDKKSGLNHDFSGYSVDLTGVVKQHDLSSDTTITTNLNWNPLTVGNHDTDKDSKLTFPILVPTSGNYDPDSVDSITIDITEQRSVREFFLNSLCRVNGDLPDSFIQGTLSSLKEQKDGLATEYKFSGQQNYPISTTLGRGLTNPPMTVSLPDGTIINNEPDGKFREVDIDGDGNILHFVDTTFDKDTCYKRGEIPGIISCDEFGKPNGKLNNHEIIKTDTDVTSVEFGDRLLAAQAMALGLSHSHNIRNEDD